MIEFLAPKIEKVDGEVGVWKGGAIFTGEEPFFADHFPGFPLVPGVLLFEILRCTAEEAMVESGHPVRLAECSRIRFIQPVIPPAELEAVVSLSPRKPLQVKSELFNSEREKVATASLVFELAEAQG